jgi:hypothetical protein
MAEYSEYSAFLAQPVAVKIDWRGGGGGFG